MSQATEPRSFIKDVGFHRGNPRLYFQTTGARGLSAYGFVPGAPYTLEFKSPKEVADTGVILTMELSPEGKRKVCKKIVGGTTYSIIDINVRAPALDNLKKVTVSVSPGKIVITGVAA